MNYLFTDTEIGRFYDHIHELDGRDQTYEWERLSAIERYRREYQRRSAGMTGPATPIHRPKAITRREFRTTA